MTKEERINKWIETLNNAEFDSIGIMRMTIQVKNMLVHDMEDWRKSIVSDEENVIKLNEQNMNQHETIRKLTEVIEEQNERIAIQSPDVVRCRDCKHAELHKWEGHEAIYCTCHEEQGYDPEPEHPLDWFCADGEIKDIK